MFRKHDRLVLYRPYLRANVEEELLFGGRRAADGAAVPPDPALFEFLPSTTSCSLPSFVNYHLLYGSVTVVCKLEFTAPNVLPTADRDDALSTNEHAPGAVYGTILSLRALKGAAQSWTEAELWLSQDAPALSPAMVPGTTSLLRIRCSADALRAMCPSTGLQGEGALADLPLRAGQGVFIAGGIDVLASSTLTFLSAGEGDGDFLNDLLSVFGGDMHVSDCTTSAVRAEGACAEVGYVASEAAIIPLCSLPALACSPSLFSPVPLAQALKVFRTASAGCVLVQASLQPMHPSVRLLPATEAPTGLLEAVDLSVGGRGKKQRFGSDDVQVPADHRTRSGYQLVRLISCLPNQFIGLFTHSHCITSSPDASARFIWGGALRAGEQGRGVCRRWGHGGCAALRGEHNIFPLLRPSFRPDDPRPSCGSHYIGPHRARPVRHAAGPRGRHRGGLSGAAPPSRAAGGGGPSGTAARFPHRDHL